jgi:hypothetical protein
VWVGLWTSAAAVLVCFACALAPALRADSTSKVPAGVCARLQLIKQIKASKKDEWSALQHKLAVALTGPSMAFWLEGTGCYRMPARVALLRLWAAARAAFFALGLVTAALAAIVALTREDGATDAEFVGTLVAAVSYIACSAISTAANRRRIHAWLSSRVVQSENRAAATIACLVGQTASPKVALKGAQGTFVALPFGAMKAEHFTSNSDSGLFERTCAVPLGACDVFLSHSWHDDGVAKWAALRSWASDFAAQHANRLPSVWLDVSSLRLQPRCREDGMHHPTC